MQITDPWAEAVDESALVPGDLYIGQINGRPVVTLRCVEDVDLVLDGWEGAPVKFNPGQVSGPYLRVKAPLEPLVLTDDADTRYLALQEQRHGSLIYSTDGALGIWVQERVTHRFAIDLGTGALMNSTSGAVFIGHWQLQARIGDRVETLLRFPA